MRVYLDDERTPPVDGSWTKIRNPRTLINLVRYDHLVEEISFDHDLGYYEDGVEITGYHVLCEVEKRCYLDEGYCPPYVSVHSANGGARPKMELGCKKIMQFRNERIGNHKQYRGLR